MFLTSNQIPRITIYSCGLLF